MLPLSLLPLLSGRGWHQIRFWMFRQYQWFTCMLIKIEVLRQIAKLRSILPHVRTRIRSTIRVRVEPLPVQKIILDELDEGVKAQRLMVDESALGIW